MSRAFGYLEKDSIQDAFLQGPFELDGIGTDAQQRFLAALLCEKSIKGLGYACYQLMTSKTVWQDLAKFRHFGKM